MITKFSLICANQQFRDMTSFFFTLNYKGVYVV